jgi:CBS domain-containing protein
LTLRVRDVMETDVRTVSPAMSLSELEEVLLREGIGAVPVCEGGRVVGLVSRTDVLKHLQVEEGQAAAFSGFYLEPFDVEDVSEEDRKRVSATLAARLRDATVADVMSASPIRVAPDATLEEAARRMLDRRVHRLLVMEGDALRGILSSVDLLRLFAAGRARAD